VQVNLVEIVPVTECNRGLNISVKVIPTVNVINEKRDNFRSRKVVQMYKLTERMYLIITRNDIINVACYPFEMPRPS